MYDMLLSKRLTSLLAILGLSVLVLFSILGGHKHTSVLTSPKQASIFFRSGSSEKNPSIPPQLSPAHQMPDEPEILAQSFLVQLINDSTPLLSRRSFKQMRPASLTKILTSVLAIEELDENAPVVFSSFAKSAGEKESPVPVGEAFIRDNAVRFAIIESANDAAVALAEAMGRKRGAFSFDDAIALFVQRANQKAKSLGMENSQFQNPTGLDDDKHYTTAEDLFRLVSYAWKNHPEIWNFSRANEADINSLTHTTYHIIATNQLLNEFPALLGGKTGLTDKAKGALILLYPIKPDRVAVIIILGSDDRFEDGKKLIQWLEEGFRNS